MTRHPVARLRELLGEDALKSGNKLFAVAMNELNMKDSSDLRFPITSPH
jgi:hypothetical protein